MPLTELERRVVAAVEPEAVSRFLRDLVRIPSVSPPGNTVAAAAYCAHWFEREGITHEIVACQAERPSVIATLPGREAHPLLAFNAHLDTVPVEDVAAWHHDPFGGEIVDGCLYGRGAGDDKGSVTAQVMAATALRRAGVPLIGSLVVNPVADEEDTGAYGTGWLRESGWLRPDLLVIGEQTNNQVAVAERSTHWIELTLHGQGGHGAMPWQGVNAVLQMAGVLTQLKHELARRLAHIRHAYLPPATVNFGTISGGLKPNMVPAVCRATLDCRLPPGLSEASLLAELTALLDDYNRHVEPVHYSLQVIYSDSTPVNTDPEDPLVIKMQSALTDVVGQPQPLTGYLQSGDGRFFAADGIPIVIFGPSRPEVGHAADEHVSVAQVVEAAQVYALTAMRLLGLAGPHEAA